MTIRNTSAALALVGMRLARDGSGLPAPGAAATLTLDQLQEATREGVRFREAQVREIEGEDRVVELAFASETPVMRWFGEEVLSMDPGAMRTERLANAAPLLMDHNWRDQVGVVLSVTIGDDRKARAVVRLGRSARATEILQDIQDGIRSKVSVAYEIKGYAVAERDGLPDLVTITDWDPYEISIVSVPADDSVGVGRSADAQAPLSKSPEEGGGAPEDGDAVIETPPPAASGRSYSMKTKILRDAAGNLVRAKVDDAGEVVEVIETLEQAGEGVRDALTQGTSAERTRVATIMAMGDQFSAPELAREFVQGSGTPDQFREKLLERMSRNRGGDVTDAAGSVGLSDAEAGRFSIVRALRALANPNDKAAQKEAAFEFEVSHAAAERAGKSPQGIMVPPEVLTRALVPSHGERVPLSSGTTSGAATGGHLVSTQLLTSSFVDILRARSVLMTLATPLTGLVGLVDIPKLTQGQTGYWIGEDDAAPETGIALGQLTLSPKTAAGLVEITRRMLKQSSMDVEAIVRADLARAIAQTIDLAGFYGPGTGSQPLGISKMTGINVVDFGGAASGGASLPTFGEVLAMETEVAADNADVASMAYVFNARMRGHFKGTEQFPSTGRTIWESGNSVNGYRTEVSNQVVAEDVFFGNFADALIGMWGGLDLTIDPFTHSDRGRLRIVAMQDVDWGVRREESFTYGTDAA